VGDVRDGPRTGSAGDRGGPLIAPARYRPRMPRLRQATLVHEGGNRFTATTGTQRVIAMGDKVETGSLSPVETIVVCLAACSAMDVTGIMAKKRQEVSSYRIHVAGTQRDEYPQILTTITVTHEIEGPVVDEAAVRRSIELSALKYCPVNAMLSAGNTEVHHRYIARQTGEAPLDAEGEVVVTGPYKRPEIVA
jgi:putative redox protein